MQESSRTMSTWIMSEAAVMASSQESTSSASSNKKKKKTSSGTEMEIQSAKCDCCGLTEECTPAYIDRIRERYAGKWICGLCSEAVKDEMVRSEGLVSTEEALASQLNVCNKFRSSWPPATDPTLHLITAVRQILRRGVRSTPASPMRVAGAGGEMTKPPALTRSGSCFPTLSS